MVPEAKLSCVYSIFCGALKVDMYPSSPASPHPLPRSLPPPSASATPCVSGQISPTVGSAGLCGGLFILERGLPSGSLHLSKHPPGRCSVFPASHSLPLLPHMSHPNPALLSLTPSFCFITPSLRSSRHPDSLSIFPFLFLISCAHRVFLILPTSIVLVMLFLLLLLFLMIQCLLYFHL